MLPSRFRLALPLPYGLMHAIKFSEREENATLAYLFMPF